MEFSITLVIIVVTCIVSLIAFSQHDLMGELSMWPYKVDQKKQYFRFVSSGFVHGNYQHLFFNMFSLYFFGQSTEQIFGAFFKSSTTLFIVYYLLAIILSDVPSYLRHRKDPNYQSIGASGAVSACIFTTMLAMPWETFYVPIPVPAIVYGFLYLGYCVYMSRNGNNGINHDAHLWGAVFGVVFPIALNPEIGKFFINAFLAKFA